MYPKIDAVPMWIRTIDECVGREHSPKGNYHWIMSELLFDGFGFDQTSKTVLYSSKGKQLNPNKMNRRSAVLNHLGTAVWPDKNRPMSLSCPKMISQEKWMILTPLQKLPNNVGDLGKLIVATGFEWIPKVQKIAQSGHTAWKFWGLSRNSGKLAVIDWETSMVVWGA